MKIAFELRADAGEVSSVSVSLPGGVEYDPSEELLGTGYIVLNPDAAEKSKADDQERENERAAADLAKVEALDRVPVLKRTVPPSSKSTTEKKAS